MQRLLPYMYFIFSCTLCFAQNNRSDSLKKALSAAKEDTNKVNTLLQLGKYYVTSSPEEAMRYSIQARDLAQELQFESGKASAFKNIGMVYYNQTKYVETIANWKQSYLLFESIDDKSNEALLLSNLGSVYMNEGDDVNALDNFYKSLKLAEQRGDKHKMAIAMGNIGTVYSNNKSTYDKAVAYYLKALPLSEELGDKNVTGGVLVNIGEVYLNRDKNDSALYYFKKSLVPYENTENIPYSLNDIGKVYTKEGNYGLAKQYHKQALSFAKKSDLQLDVVQSYLGLGVAYYKAGDFKRAINEYKNGRSIADSID